MSDLRPCRGCCQRGPSGVGKKIEHFYGASGALDLFREPVPVGGLLREKTGVLEAEGLQIKGKRAVMNLPLFGKTEKLPFTAAFFAAVVVAVPVFPSSVFPRRIPDDLGIRTDQNIISPAFQFFPF